MPIAGLTSQEYGFPRLGKIRKGAEKPNEKQPGKDLDFFRFTVAEGREDILKTVEGFYGKEPKELKVWLPYEAVAENFDPWMKEYGTSSVKRICDGNQQVLWLPEGSATYAGVDYGDEPLPCQKKIGHSCKCQRSAALKVMLVELFAKGVCGYFDLVTSSEDDIRHINSVLNYAYQFKRSLLGIPFIVRRLPEEKSVPLKDKRIKKEFSLVRLEVDPRWMARQIEGRYQAMMGVEPKAIAPAYHNDRVLTAATIDLLPSESEQNGSAEYQEFLKYLNLADTSEKLERLETWAKVPDRWQAIHEGKKGIENLVLSLLEEAAESFAESGHTA